MALASTSEAGATDERVAELANEQGRVVITFDLDFGEMSHFRGAGRLGVIVLRLRDQTVESVDRVLDLFFSNPPTDVDLDHSLVVLREHSLRIVRPD